MEVDSAEWHDDPLAQIADPAQRQAELEARGERVLRVRGARARSDRFLARLRAAGVPDALSYFFLARRRVALPFTRTFFFLTRSWTVDHALVDR